MKLLLLAAVVFAAQVDSLLLGSQKCTYGPSYWCASFANAKECSTTQHCIQNYWLKKRVLPKSSNGVLEESACTFCKDIVGDVAKFIGDNATRAEVVAYLDRACGYMPDAFSQDKCKEISEHYLDEFLAAVESAVDPDTVCSMLMLCNQGSKKPLDLKMALRKSLIATKFSAALKETSKGTEICNICKEAETFIKSEVDNKDNQAAMTKFLQAQCQKLGTDLAAECQALVSFAVPEIVKLVDSNLNEQLCVTLGMCAASAEDKAAASKAVRKSLSTFLRSPHMKTHITGVASRVGADECTTCEEIFNYIHLFIANNETADEVKTLLENDVCPQLGEFADTCKELVDVYFPQFWKMFLEALDPKTICTELGLCNSSLSVVEKPKAEVSLKSSVQCVLCEFVLDKLASMIPEKATEAEVEAALDKVCSILPKTIESECDAFVKKYTDVIVKDLVDGVAAKVICSTIGLCSAVEVKTPRKLGDENCIMCEMAVAYVKSALTKNATQQQIMAELDKVCGYLPTELTSECTDMVKKYGPQIMDLVASKLEADAVCKAIGLCPSSLAYKGKADGLVHLYNRGDRASNV